MKRCPRLTNKQIKKLQEIVDNNQSSGPEVRKATAILLLNKDTSIEAIIELTRYKRRRVYEVRHKYLVEGASALIDKRKGEPKKLLTKKQREKIVKTVKQKSPQEFGYRYPYWTTGILGDFIERNYNVKYKSKTSYYLLFRQAKFTYHKPGRVYHKRDEQEVRKWRKRTTPAIKRAMKDKDTFILTEDEMILSTQTTFQKIWLPEGEYPKIEISNNRENRSVYGFLDIKTGQEHAFKTERQNMYLTVKVLKKVRKIYPEQKLLILWDGSGWHRGSEVQKFIKKDKKIKTIYFPRYSPEENPQEHVWKSGRSQVTHNHFIENIDRATDEFIAYLNSTKFAYSLLGFSALS